MNGEFFWPSEEHHTTLFGDVVETGAIVFAWFRRRWLLWRLRIRCLKMDQAYVLDGAQDVFVSQLFLNFKDVANGVVCQHGFDFLKPLFPNLQLGREDFINYCVKPAVELVQSVRAELHKMDPEYPQVSLRIAI